jgi:hypothetical protein
MRGYFPDISGDLRYSGKRSELTAETQRAQRVFVFLLFAERAKSKKKLASRARHLVTAGINCNPWNAIALQVFYPVLFAKGDSVLCFPASQRET